MRYEFRSHTTKNRSHYVLRGLKVKAFDLHHVAKDPQHFPGRAGVTQGLYHRVETLHTPFGIHESTRGLAKRCDRQQHVCAAHVGLEGAQADNHFGFRQRSDRLRARGTVEFGFAIEQKHRFQRAAQHLPCVQAAGARRGVDKLGAHRVRRFGQVTDGCTGVLRNEIGNRQQGRSLAVVGRRIA